MLVEVRHRTAVSVKLNVSVGRVALAKTDAILSFLMSSVATTDHASNCTAPGRFLEMGKKEKEEEEHEQHQ